VILKLPKCVLFGAPIFTTMCSTLVPGVIFEKMQNATHVASHVSKACCFANSHRFRNVFWAPPRMHFGKRKTDGKRCNITKHYVHSIKSVVVVCDTKLRRALLHAPALKIRTRSKLSMRARLRCCAPNGGSKESSAKIVFTDACK